MKRVLIIVLSLTALLVNPVLAQQAEDEKVLQALDSLTRHYTSLQAYSIDVEAVLYGNFTSATPLEKTVSSIVKVGNNYKVVDELSITIANNDYLTVIDKEQQSIFVQLRRKPHNQQKKEDLTVFKLVNLDSLVTALAKEMDKQEAEEGEQELPARFLKQGLQAGEVNGIELQDQADEVEKMCIYYNRLFWVTRVVMYCGFTEELEGKQTKPRLELNYKNFKTTVNNDPALFSTAGIVARQGEKWTALGKYKNFKVIYLN